MTDDYYVDQLDGDDTAAGTSEATAWRTLAKLAAFSTANPWAITRGVFLRRGANYPGQLRLINQGHPGRWLRIRPYGDPSATAPHIVASGLGAFEAAVHLDSVLATWVEDLSVDGGAVPLSPGIGRVSITAPERAAPFRVERCTVVNTGFDSILASFSASVVNGALGIPGGSNQQLAGVVIKDNVIDGSRNDGIAVAGSAYDVLIQGNVGSNIAAGTVPLQGGTSGDFISCHDAEGIVRIVDNEVDACVNGIHNVNFGAPCLIDGLRCKNAVENCITLEMQEEFAAGGLARLDWMIRNCTLIHGAAATGLAAVLLGRGSLNGSLISARLWNNLIINKAAVPSVLAKFYNDARSNECILDLRNNEFSRVHASGRHIEIDRGGRTPFIVSDRNRFDVDAATAFRRDGTDYTLAGWQALGYDADSTVGALGLSGDPETDFDNARLTAASACRAAGDNLGVREVPYYGAGDTDQHGFVRPPVGAWDLGPLKFRNYDEPPRELALAALATALRTINVDAGNWRSLAPLSQVLRHAPDDAAGLLSPYAYFADIREPMSRTDSHGTDDVYSRALSVDVVVVAQSWEADAEASRVIHDIELALADHTLGRTVMDLEIAENRHSVVHQGFSVAVTVKLYYRTSETDPAQRV